MGVACVYSMVRTIYAFSLDSWKCQQGHRLCQDKVGGQINSVTGSLSSLRTMSQAVTTMNMAQPFDFLGIIFLKSVSERRVERLVSSQASYHPSWSNTQDSTLALWLPIALCSSYRQGPASVDSIPSCEKPEDFVSIELLQQGSWNSQNSRRIVATEIMAACQALDLKPENHELEVETSRPTTSSVSMSAIRVWQGYRKSIEELNKASQADWKRKFLAAVERLWTSIQFYLMTL